MLGFTDIYKEEVLHRDLKLANILVHIPGEGAEKGVPPEKLKSLDLSQKDLNVEIKIADLGFARELGHSDMTDTVCGTPLVMAPEVLNGKKYNHKADVWSLGIVYFELLTGFTPFTGCDKNDLKRNLEKGAYKLPKKVKMSLNFLILGLS